MGKIYFRENTNSATSKVEMMSERGISHQERHILHGHRCSFSNPISRNNLKPNSSYSNKSGARIT